MLTLRLLCCAALLTGCDIVFSVDEVDQPTGHPVEVRGTLHRRMIENDASDAPQLSGLLPPSNVLAEVAFADGTKRDLTLGADGEFAFTWPDDSAPYSITLRSPLTEILTYQLTSRQLQLVERVTGRGNRAVVASNTLIHLTFPSDPAPGASTYLEVDSTGIWSRRFLTLATVSQPYDWSTQPALGGPIGMLENEPDMMVFLELQVVSPTFDQLSRYGIQHQPGLASGQDNAMPFDLVAPVPDKCVNVSVDQMAEMQRLLALDATGVQVGWYLFATPAAEYLPEVGFPLALRNLGSAPSPFTESFMYENPLQGFSTFAVFETATLGAASVHSTVAVPLDGTCTPVSLPTAVVKLANHFTVGGTELTAAGQSVAIDRSSLVPISFTPTETGAVDYYIVVLRDATTASTMRARIVTTEPRVLIDPDLLIPGRNYIVIANSRVGLPNAATGDFESTSSSLVASGASISTTFQVQ